MFKLDLEKLEGLEIKLPTSAGGGGLVAKSCLTLVTPWTGAHQAPLSMGFSRREYWSGLPFPSPGDLPDPGIKPTSPACKMDSLPLCDLQIQQKHSILISLRAVALSEYFSYAK